MSASNEHPASPGEVVAYRYRVRYHRRGAGSSVILLRPPELAAEVDAVVLDELAERFRVLVPVGSERVEERRVEGDAPCTCLADEGDDPAGWLECFVDGLGLMGAGLVAVGRDRAAALALASALPDQVSRVVLLGSGQGDVEDIDRAGPAPETASAVAVLDLPARSGRPPWDVSRIVSFLGA